MFLYTISSFSLIVFPSVLKPLPYVYDQTLLISSSHRGIPEIPVKINEKPVLPVPLLDGAALDLVHIQIIVDKMGQHMV